MGKFIKEAKMLPLVYLSIKSDPSISDEQKQKEDEYKEYVDEHVQNVKRAWKKLSQNKKFKEYIKTVTDHEKLLYTFVDTLIENHDYTKYGIDEWEGYRKWYFPVDEQEKEDATRLQEMAWEHHYENNPHHWDCWYKHNNIDEMLLEYVIEMCCDWIAMSMKFGSNALDWYHSQKDIVLGEKQKIWVENILKANYSVD